MSWAVDQKLRSFIQFAKAKLDSAEAELTDEDEEDNYQELVVFTGGLTRNLKNVGAAGFVLPYHLHHVLLVVSLAPPLRRIYNLTLRARLHFRLATCMCTHRIFKPAITRLHTLKIGYYSIRVSLICVQNGGAQGSSPAVPHACLEHWH